MEPRGRGVCLTSPTQALVRVLQPAPPCFYQKDLALLKNNSSPSLVESPHAHPSAAALSLVPILRGASL